MIALKDIRDLPEAKRLLKLACIAASLWGIGFVLMSGALFSLTSARLRLEESDRIINAANTVKSYPSRGDTAKSEPIAAVSALTDSLGFKDRVGQMSSSPSGLVVQINRLYPGELTKLVEELTKNGLEVKTAEIRAMRSEKEGRLINITLAIAGER